MSIEWIEEDVIFGVKITWQKCAGCGELVFSGQAPGKVFCGGNKCSVKKCVCCGYGGIALDAHHVHGRKNSDITICVCSNCHREIHAGERTL